MDNFGDGKLKEHITSEPEVTIKTINRDNQMLILGSDGLWKVMSNQEALDCIKHVKTSQEAAEQLVEEAINRKSCVDISCIVVCFN
ncbi:phosphatase 2C family protein [Thalictrum thalictroides]|uniref:Phosphatase 2C family protein n=1 Tax=Thalictrum thalictroides TaxID=46969 RepID=A0A7J6WQE2_THATH|nr:phosphatase 2C family protein [Thalictrum thalictroides]